MQVYYLVICLVLLGATTSEGGRKDKIKRCLSMKCGEEKSPVCGSNGVSYNSTCEMKKRNCISEMYVEVEYEGYCKYPYWKAHLHCNRKQCPPFWMNDDPFCGSDKKTYKNLCVYRDAACESEKEITIKYFGECGGKNMPLPEHKEKYRCRVKKCTSEPKKRCGSDGKIYKDYCAFRRANCESDKEIFRLSLKKCKSSKSSSTLPPELLETTRKPKVKPPKVEVEEDDQMEEEDDDTNQD